MKEKNQETDYKKMYFDLKRDMGYIHSQMCDRCPFVQSCCAGCKLLKEKLKKYKN